MVLQSVAMERLAHHPREGSSDAVVETTADNNINNSSALVDLSNARVVKEGTMLKRGYRVTTKKTWTERHFVLRGTVLSYWASREDFAGGVKKARGALALSSDCAVGDIYINVRSAGKKSSKEKDNEEQSMGFVADDDMSLDETLSDESEMLPPPPPPAATLVKKKSRRSQLTSKASKLVSRSKKGKGGKGEKEQLYCFKISWLDGSKGTTMVVAESVAAGGGYDVGIADDDYSVTMGGGGPQDASLAALPRDASTITVPASNIHQQTPSRPSRMSSRSSSAPATPRVQSPINLPELQFGSGGSGGSGGAGVTTPIPLRPTGGSFSIGQGGLSGASAPPEEDFDTRSVRSAGVATPTRSRLHHVDSAPALPVHKVASVASIHKSHSADEGGHDNDAEGQEEGIQKHYNTVVSQQEKASKDQQKETMRVMYLTSKKAAHRKNTKRVVQGSKIAAAAGAAVTAGVLTAGVGLAVGLVFVGITAAAGGGGAMAEANYQRKKGKTSMTLACRTLEEAQAWKEALEAAIRGEEMEDSGHRLKDHLWSALFAKDGSTIPGAGNQIRTGLTRGLLLPSGKGGKKSQQQKQLAKSSKGGQRGGSMEPETDWRPLEGGWVLLLGCGAHGLRIFREERDSASRPKGRVSVEGGTCPPLRAHIALSADPLNAFMCLMSHGRTDLRDRQKASASVPLDASMLVPNSCQRASFRIIETIDDHMDIIHLFFRPVYLFPSWTAPRDYVLFRYWRYDPDGSYMICVESVKHQDCPPVDGFVRGKMHGVYTIAPLKTSRSSRKGGGGGGSGQGKGECLLTSLVQVDPKGWVPTVPLSPLSNQSYAEAFGVSVLLQLLDVKDALDQDRFVPVSTDARRPPKRSWKVPGLIEDESADRNKHALAGSHLRRSDAKALASSAPEIQSSPSLEDDDEDYINYDFAFSSRELPHEPDQVSLAATAPEGVPPSALASAFSTFPEPLPPEYWAEPDSNSFRVRGKMYKTDRKKFNAGPPVMRLFAVDIVETPENIMTGMCSHPTERVQTALARGDLPPFVFCLNIALPGPPCFHKVFYYAVDDRSAIDGTDGSPSSKLAGEFFFGESDEFRDKTFKLIPQIVEGNFMVRKAVGSTPCIMGTKLKQHHFRDPSPGRRYFELMLDTGSDPVAKGVIRLCLGYAKSIVVDMAFVLEGNDETTLPERVMGCARLKNVVFTGRRQVDMPQAHL